MLFHTSSPHLFPKSHHNQLDTQDSPYTPVSILKGKYRHRGAFSCHNFRKIEDRWTDRDIGTHIYVLTLSLSL